MMPRVCTICTHPDRAAIDAALVAGKMSYRRIATENDVGESAVRRHKRHLPAALVKAKAAQEIVAADDLLAQVAKLQKVAMTILGRAYSAGNLGAALGGIREARECLKLQAAMVAVALLADRERAARAAPGSDYSAIIILPDNNRGDREVTPDSVIKKVLFDRYPAPGDAERSLEASQQHYPRPEEPDPGV